MVVRPERGTTARRDRLKIVGCRPAAPAIDVPAVTLEPGAGVAGGRVRGADAGQAVVERRGIGQVDLARGVAAPREVQVRVGEARDRHLVGLERDPLGERVGARLEVTSDPAKATRPSRIPTASTQPNPSSPASVAIRPVMSISSGTVRPPGRRAARQPGAIQPGPEPERERDPGLDRAQVADRKGARPDPLAPPPGKA